MKKFVDSNRYKEDFFFNLPGPYKLLFDYICCDCEHNGVWTANFQIAQIMIGVDMPVDKKTALALFNEGQQRIIEINGGRQWFIPWYVHFQHGYPIKDNRATDKIVAFLKASSLDKVMDAFVNSQNSDARRGENFNVGPDYDTTPRVDQIIENKPLRSPLEGAEVKVEVKGVVEVQEKVKVNGENSKKIDTLVKNALDLFISSKPGYLPGKDDMSSVASILSFLKSVQGGSSDDDVLLVWEFVIKNMPRFYKDKSLKVLSNNIQSVMNQLKTKHDQHGNSKIPTNLREYLTQRGL